MRCRRPRYPLPPGRRLASASPGMLSAFCWNSRKPRSRADRGRAYARMLQCRRVGQAEAVLRSGRAFLYETLEEAWRVATAGDRLTVSQRAMLWLASTHAVTSAKQA